MFIAVFLLSILFLSLVFAEDATAPTTQSATGLNKDAITKTTKDATDSVNQATNTLLERQVQIPSIIETPARIVFGIPQNIKIEYLIVMICIWLILFLVIFEAIGIISLFGGKIGNFFATLAIMILLSITGTIAQVAIFFYDFWNLFAFFKEWSIAKIILSVIVLGIFLFIGIKAAKSFKNRAEIDEAEIKAKKAGAGLQVAENKFEQEKTKVGG